MTDNDCNSSGPIWTLGPISVKRTTDVIALVAFMLSVIGLSAQVRDYLRGANPEMIAPEQVTFGSTKVLKVFFNEPFLITTAIMGYVNDAPVGFNAAISREYMRFEIDGKRYQYAAHQAVQTRSETSKLAVTPKEDSGPFALNAGSAVSREVLFEPHRVKCEPHGQDCVGLLPGLKWQDFIAAVRNNRVISVTLLADVYGGKTLSVQCRIVLNDNDLNALSNQDQEWSAPDCQEQKKPSLWDSILKRVFGKKDAAEAIIKLPA